jgi:hypothetical protein
MTLSITIHSPNDYEDDRGSAIMLSVMAPAEKKLGQSQNVVALMSGGER